MVREASTDVLEEPPKQPLHYYRTSAWMALMLGSGALWYVLDERNVLDWDKPSLKSRLTGESWRFDNNDFGMNFILHPINGSGFYAFARANRFTPSESLGVSFGTSMIWEYVIEYNERVSINDVVTTPVAGMVIGEFAHKLAWYLGSSPSPTSSRTALGFALGPTVAVHRALDNERPAWSLPDRLGYTSRIWHEFSVESGLSETRTWDGRTEVTAAFGASGRLVSLRDYRRPRSFSSWYSSLDFARLRLSVDGSPWGTGVELASDVWMAGHHRQTLDLHRRGTLRTLGVAAAYRYRNSWGRGHDERRSWIGLPGFVLDWQRLGAFAHTRLEILATPLFGAVSFPSFPRVAGTRPGSRMKTILEKHGYAYGWGGSMEVTLEAALGALRLETAITSGIIDSIEGWDRDQEELTWDVPGSEHWLSVQQRLGVALPDTPLVLGVAGANHGRWSRLGPLTTALGRKNAEIWLRAEF